jgi:hypothetical protein
MKGLLIKERWLDLILSGMKTWEIRGKATTVRGRIGLIQSGSGMVHGVCEVVDVQGPLSLEDMQANCHRHCIAREDIPGVVHYDRTYAWVLQGARRLSVPVRYDHPNGAVIWVNLPEQVDRQVEAASRSVRP